MNIESAQKPLIIDKEGGIGMTASACAACGLIEIARNVPEFEGKIYYDAAIKLLKAMDEKFCNYTLEEDSVVGFGTERWTDDSEAIGKTANIPIIYGDYYFTEAIYKLKGFDLLFE